MACYSRTLLLLLLLSISFCCSTCFIFEEDANGFGRTHERNLANSSLLCGAVNCLRGVCTESEVLPSYQCKCDEGWKSPFNTSWIPCVLPNCSLDLGCNGSSSSPPAPPLSFSICALPVCGNGECTPSSNASLLYECKCDPGYTNLFNTSNGYCIQSCAVGADCANLNIPLSGSPLSPPPPPSPSQNSSQGTSSSPSSSNQTTPSQGSMRAFVSNWIMICGLLLLQQMGW